MKYLALLVLLTACGTDPAAEKESKNAEPVKYQETPHALAADEFPKCNKGNDRQLVYIIPEKMFYTCESGDWQEININVDQRESASTLWIDSVSQRQWYILGISNQQTFCGDLGGSRVWERQTPDQIKEALRRGIFEGANLKVWVDSNLYVYSENPDVEFTSSSAVGNQANAFNICLVAK